MFLVFTHLIAVAICLAMKIADVNSNVIGFVFVALSSISVSVYVIGAKDLGRWAKIAVLIGFVLRLVLVFIDVFITRLPDTGTDDDGFYRESLETFNNGTYDFSQNMHGNYSGFLALTYFFIGSSRFAAQYTNVLFFAISAIVLLKAMCNFGVTEKNQRIPLLVLCFMPNSMLYNAILRRETIMELCICSSMFFLSRWHMNQRLPSAVLSVLFIALASLFHTAFIIGAPLLVIYYALYDKKKHAVSLSINNLGRMVILLICVLVIGTGFLSMWSNKFSSVNDMDDIYLVANRARGGSVYLADYQVNSIGQLVLFTPLKLFYFLFSPVPWMFRNVMDVVSFFLDAMIYLALLIKVLRGNKTDIARLMLTEFIALSIVFALGTFNSGTAIRHRFSVLPYLLVAYSLTEKRKQSSNDDERNNRSTTTDIDNKERRLI